MSASGEQELTSLDVSSPVWDRFFTVAPLVVIGTREPDGSDDLAPKHMVMSLGWDNLFGFMCSETHGTYRNIQREREFTVSFPVPDQVLLASLSASPRCDDESKPFIRSLPTFPATVVNGVFLENGYLYLECHLDRIIDGFGRNSLIAGRIVAAQVRSSALRDPDRDDQDLLMGTPLLAYVSPGRYATIDSSRSFPFPKGFRRGDE